jgi:hypothetical protein
MGYDRFAEMVIDEKADLYSVAVPEAWNIFLTHDSQVASCRVIRDAKGRFIPDGEEVDLNRRPLL